MRRSTALMLGALVLPATACSSVWDSCAERMTVPAEVLTESELQAVPEPDANLVLDVTSTSEASAELEVLVDGARALHVALPEASGCGHESIHSYGYRLPRGEVTLTVATDAGEPESLRLSLRSRPRWVVVNVSEHFPLSVEAYDEEPMWG